MWYSVFVYFFAILFYVCMVALLACMSAYHMHALPMEARRRHKIPLWMLHIEPRSSGRASHAPKLSNVDEGVWKHRKRIRRRQGHQACHHFLGLWVNDSPVIAQAGLWQGLPGGGWPHPFLLDSVNWSFFRYQGQPAMLKAGFCSAHLRWQCHRGKYGCDIQFPSSWPGAQPCLGNPPLTTQEFQACGKPGLWLGRPHVTCDSSLLFSQPIFSQVLSRPDCLWRASKKQKENRISSSMEGILQEKQLHLLLFSPVAFSTGKETQGIHISLLYVCVLFFITVRSFPQARVELSTCKYNGNLKWLECSFSAFRVSRMNTGHQCGHLPLWAK